MAINTTNRFGAGPVFLVGVAILFSDLASMACLYLMGKFESWHWLFAPGTTQPLTQAALPYFILGIGCAWALFVVDAVLTGQLFWGRGTGASNRKKGPVGFWLGVIFQAGLSINLIGLGVALKFHLIR